MLSAVLFVSGSFDTLHTVVLRDDLIPQTQSNGYKLSALCHLPVFCSGNRLVAEMLRCRERCGPIYETKHCIFYSVAHEPENASTIYLIGVAPKRITPKTSKYGNQSPLGVLELLHRTAEGLEILLGPPLDSDAISENRLCILEYVQEAVENGIGQIWCSEEERHHDDTVDTSSTHIIGSFLPPVPSWKNSLSSSWSPSRGSRPSSPDSSIKRETGLFFAYDGFTYPVPLNSVNVEAEIVGFVARVKVHQTFYNKEDRPLEAVYTFSFLGSKSAATVCAFSAIKGDGRVLRAVLKEKKDAEETYDDAIAQGHSAYLLLSHSDDTFTVSIGNLSPSESITVCIEYVSELELQDEAVRFCFPRLLCPKGDPDGGGRVHTRNECYRNSKQKDTLSVRVHAASPISQLRCPSHPLELMYSIKGRAARAVLRLGGTTAATSRASDGSFIERDFVLLVDQRDAHKPHCWTDLVTSKTLLSLKLSSPFAPDDINLHRWNDEKGCKQRQLEEGQEETIEERKEETEAVCMLAFYPDVNCGDGIRRHHHSKTEQKERSVDSKKMTAKATEGEQWLHHERPRSLINTEVIFVVDRSNSMEGERIHAAAETLSMCISALPPETFFNVVCFGSTHSVLFPFCNSEPESASVSSLAATDEETTAAAPLYVPSAISRSGFAPNGSASAENSAAVERALALARSMSANMGGTELLRPLKDILEREPMSGVSRQLFVLTDGDVPNASQVVRYVHRKSRDTRVFSFGVGAAAAARGTQGVCAGVARAGHGAHEFISSPRRLSDAVKRQLSRALKPCLTGLRLEWSENLRPMIRSVHPARLPAVYSGSRLLIYAFLSVPSSAFSTNLAAKEEEGDVASEAEATSPKAEIDMPQEAPMIRGSVTLSAMGPAFRPYSATGKVAKSEKNVHRYTVPVELSLHLPREGRKVEESIPFDLQSNPNTQSASSEEEENPAKIQEKRIEGKEEEPEEASYYNCIFPWNNGKSYGYSGQVIRKLAAKRAIQDIQDDWSTSAYAQQGREEHEEDAKEDEPTAPTTRAAEAKREIVRLSLLHGVSSTHTAFVIVDERPGRTATQGSMTLVSSTTATPTTGDRQISGSPEAVGTAERDDWAAAARQRSMFFDPIHQEARTARAAATHRLPAALSGAISWRTSHIAYRKNELFIVVKETLSLFSGPQDNLQFLRVGRITSGKGEGGINAACFLSGTPELRVKLSSGAAARLVRDARPLFNCFRVSDGYVEGNRSLSRCSPSALWEFEDVRLHQCVRPWALGTSGVLTMIPPDGHFNVMQYRLRPSFFGDEWHPSRTDSNLPVSVIASLEHSAAKDLETPPKCTKTTTTDKSIRGGNNSTRDQTINLKWTVTLHNSTQRHMGGSPHCYSKDHMYNCNNGFTATEIQVAIPMSLVQGQTNTRGLFSHLRARVSHGLAKYSSGKNAVVWSLPTLEPKETRSITVWARVDVPKHHQGEDLASFRHNRLPHALRVKVNYTLKEYTASGVEVMHVRVLEKGAYHTHKWYRCLTHVRHEAKPCISIYKE